MFMAKNELKNAGQLTRIKLGNAKFKILRTFLVIVAIFLINLIPSLIMMFKVTDGLKSYRLPDFSIWFLLGILLAIVIWSCIERISNQNFAMYPQTNTSRFLSTQALYYSWILLTAALLLAMYLIQSGIMAIIATGHKNIYLVYKFDPAFIISGFLVLIIYASIIAGFISLVTALIHKFKIYAVGVFAAMAGFFIANPLLSLKFIQSGLGFLVYEPRLILFICKGFIIWAALFALSFIVNKFTVYYKTSLRLSDDVTTGIAAACIIAIFALGSVALIMAPSIEKSSAAAQQDYPAGPLSKQLEFDISALPKGGSINIITGGDIGFITNPGNVTSSGSDNEGRFYIYEDGTREEYPEEYLVLEYYDQMSNIDGDRLIINYTLPLNIEDSQNIGWLIKPDFKARLEGNTLYLDYSYEKNVKAVFLPIWSFMGQFVYFKDRGITKESFFRSYSGCGGSISLRIE